MLVNSLRRIYWVALLAVCSCGSKEKHSSQAANPHATRFVEFHVDGGGEPVTYAHVDLGEPADCKVSGADISLDSPAPTATKVSVIVWCK